MPAPAARADRHRTRAGCSRNNYVHDNNNADVPSSGSAELGPPGTGIVIAGGRNDTVMDNHVHEQRQLGRARRSVHRLGTPPPIVALRGRRRTSCPGRCYSSRSGATRSRATSSRATGGSGIRPTATSPTSRLRHDPGNCWHDNTDPAGVTSSPADLQVTNGTCGQNGATAALIGSDLTKQVQCATEIFGAVRAGRGHLSPWRGGPPPTAAGPDDHAGSLRRSPHQPPVPGHASLRGPDLTRGARGRARSGRTRVHRVRLGRVGLQPTSRGATGSGGPTLPAVKGPPWPIEASPRSSLEAYLHWLDGQAGTTGVYEYVSEPAGDDQPVLSVRYMDCPEPGTLLALHVRHLDRGQPAVGRAATGAGHLRRFLRPAWAWALADIGDRVRTTSVFLPGDTIEIGEPISEESPMDAFVLWHQLLTDDEAILPLDGHEVVLVQALPVHRERARPHPARDRSGGRRARLPRRAGRAGGGRHRRAADLVALGVGLLSPPRGARGHSPLRSTTPARSPVWWPSSRDDAAVDDAWPGSPCACCT